jgi:hypothetical protein
MKKISLLLVLMIVGHSLTSCGIRKNKGDKDVSSGNTQKAIIGEAPKDNPETQINWVQLAGNILTIEVSYSGGCEQQSFDLVGNELILKSFPPRRNIVLVRDSKGDACREFITRTLEFDITELHHNKKVGDVILLVIEGFKNEVRYVYH